MNLHDWKIYDKNGSPLNWTPDPLIQLSFGSTTGKGAEGYLITDVSGIVTDVKITNGGYLYTDTTTTVSYNYALGNSATAISLSAADVSVITEDVSIFNPEATTTETITDLTIDLSTNFVYPSVTYAGAVFLNPISQGLIETEHLYIFEDTSSGYARPIDQENQYLVFEFVGKDDEIKFFEVDDNTQEITWYDALAFDVSIWVLNTPLQLNIGFKADQEGVYERTLRIYHYFDNTLHILGDILVNAEAIGEDERFRTLLTNFGLPDPKGMKDIFKRSDINEDLIDWELINYKSKHMILEYDKIMPYVGTYKALINAIKWLGYDDIWIREWFLNVKENTKLSLVVPFDADDRLQTILKFSADERKILKKLNQLSLNYCITRETGEIDIWGTPLTENCYEYNIKEVFIKLLGLKKWLEEHIIGINCRIVDITGEGIYFERVQNLIYATDNMEYDYFYHQSLTPYGIDENSELFRGDSSIRLSLKELTITKLENLPYRFIDMADSAWNPNDPSVYYSLTDPSYLADSSSFLLMGATFEYPFAHVEDIMYRISVEKDNAGVIGTNLVSNPLFIYENDIRFYNYYDTSTIFSNDTSISLTIYLEHAYIRDPSIDEWEDSIVYTISPYTYLDIDASSIKVLYNSGTYIINSGKGIIYRGSDSSIAYNTYFNPISFTVNASAHIIAELATQVTAPYADQYKLETSTGGITDFDDYVSLNPDTNSVLQYAYDSNYHVPLLSFKNFKYTDASGVTTSFETDKLYHLDILDGKIEMNAGVENPINSSDNTTMYINWNYDTSLEEQMITVNVVYDSPRMDLWQIDPSIYYWADPSGLTGGNDPNIYIKDNSIYTMYVNHIGEYNIEVFGWDNFNTLFYNYAKEPYDVWIKSPIVYTLLDVSCNIKCSSTYMTWLEASVYLSENKHPIYDRSIPLQGLTLGIDSDGSTYINVPSITYFQDVPEPGSINKFYNMTERVLSISGTYISVDNDYQNFYTGDNVTLVKFDKGKYSSLVEASSYIDLAAGSNPTSITLDQMPSGITLDSSSEIYILNDTYRSVTNASNGSSYFSADVTGYVFRENQLVGITVTDTNMPGYRWGASYRVTSVNGTTHIFDNTIPEFFLNDPARYTIQVKHGFSTFSTFTIPTESATEVNNVFKIYLDDSYCHEYYLDNTFIYENILFDEELINDYWYDPSTYNVSYRYYYHDVFVDIDTSTFIILKAEYDPSNYMLNQKNIWTARYNDDNTVYFKVFNYLVPYVFDSSRYYSVSVESYDSYGNLIETH